MMKANTVEKEMVAYRLKLGALASRFLAGERSTVSAEAQSCGDALISLMVEAPLTYRRAIDDLIDRYESLRVSCAN